MTDKCKAEGCQISDTGVCLEHGIEMERRENSERIVKAIQGIMLLIIGASFVYTTIINQQAIDRTNILAESLATVQLSSTTIAVQMNSVAAIVERNTKDIDDNTRDIDDNSEDINSNERLINDNTREVRDIRRILVGGR